MLEGPVDVIFFGQQQLLHVLANLAVVRLKKLFPGLKQEEDVGPGHPVRPDHTNEGAVGGEAAAHRRLDQIGEELRTGGNPDA